ncbi:serine/threonine-protein kinase [Mycobacterium sp. NPDC050551]|uniref:serine/threonine-protein kinase n=1 Tax=Mycobacterium sp. NPDC050551 TaxID=3155407 RepID=UPI0034356A2B
MTRNEPTVLGGYRLLESLGAGQVGHVFRAYDTSTGRFVALKVLSPRAAADPDFRDRFRREGLAAARLNDPHIVPIHGFGEIDGQLYVDMRLIEGHDLGALLRDAGRLDPTRSVAIVEQAALALDAAHHIGLVHRDLKPSNILVTPDDFVYLVDFGSAGAAQGSAGTHAWGSPAYTAPELLTDAAADARSDVYSLTCVLFECLTGRQPDRPAGTPPRVTDVVSDLPRALDAVVELGMARDVERRFPTASALAAAARAAIAPRQSVPPTAPWAPRPARAPTQPTVLRPQISVSPVHSRGGRRVTVMACVVSAVVLVAAGVIAGFAGATERSVVGNATTAQPEPNAASPYGEPVELPFGSLEESPSGIAVGPDRTVYVTLFVEGGIWMLPRGAGAPTRVAAPDVTFGQGIAVDTANRLYIADADPSAGEVVRLAPGAVVEKLPITDLRMPTGVAVDRAGSVYVTDHLGNQVVRLPASGGGQIRLPFRDVRAASYVAVDKAGNVYVSQGGGVGVIKLYADSDRQEVLPFPGLVAPFGVAVDGQNNVYVSDYLGGKVLRLDARTNVQSEIPFTDLVKPSALAVDNQGSVYVSDERNRVLKVALK